MGMIIYELMSLQYPYYECNSPIEVVKATMEGKEPLLTDQQREMYLPLLPLWRRCLALNPEDRPSASDLRDQLQSVGSEINNSRYAQAAISPPQSEASSPVSTPKSIPLPAETQSPTTGDEEKSEVSEVSEVSAKEKKSSSRRVRNPSSSSGSIKRRKHRSKDKSPLNVAKTDVEGEPSPDISQETL